MKVEEDRKQEEDDTNAYHDDNATHNSKAFITHHLSDLGLTRSPTML